MDRVRGNRQRRCRVVARDPAGDWRRGEDRPRTGETERLRSVHQVVGHPVDCERVAGRERELRGRPKSQDPIEFGLAQGPVAVAESHVELEPQSSGVLAEREVPAEGRIVPVRERDVAREAVRRGRRE